MRGKHAPPDGIAGCTGITPADAGKTKATLNERFVNQDHPRGCGENASSGCPRGTNLGSPPRMRGKPDNPCPHSAAAGITPADAGKTCGEHVQNNVVRDHPRGCGENSTTGDGLGSITGSPPRMRGKPIRICCHMYLAGITPADAGKTMMWRRIFRGE